MRAFYLRVGMFLLLQVMIFFLCRPDASLRSERNYLAATIDKHRLLDRARPPRVIALGGSNVPFGIQSDLLERELGRPVVNMGLVAGLGLEFMLNEVSGSVREGDWVILSPEHDLFDGGSRPLNQQQILEYRPASLWHVPLGRAARLLSAQGLTIFGGAVRRALNIHLDSPVSTPDDSAYSRQGFNQWGDYIAHYPRAGTLAGNLNHGRPVVVRRITPAVRSELARFARLCHARGARCFYTCPPQPGEVLEPNAAIVEANIAMLGTIPYLEVLDHSSDHVYEPALFYDTGYHLTEAGARQRTEKIIRELKQLAAHAPTPADPRPASTE